MSDNKHALIRYRALDSCFRNYSVKYAFKDLLEYVNKTLETYDPTTNGISRSQLYEDIAFMESSNGWQIDLQKVKQGRTVYYKYADPNYSIDNTPLNEAEINRLREVMRVLSQFKGMPQFEWIEEVITKLQKDLQPVKEKKVISFDSNPYLKGVEWLGVLHSAVCYKKVLKIIYRDFRYPDAYEVELHPYYLRQYNGRWFVLGFNPAKDTPFWNMALDRIEDINELNKVFVETEVDFEGYFEDFIGVSRPKDGKIEKVVLQVCSDRAGYVLTKPLHGSQKKISHDETGLKISLEVMINKELFQLLHSFGDQLEVLEPISLRLEMASQLKKALEKYGKQLVSD